MARTFTLALSQFAARAGDRADQVVRQVVLEVASRVIIRSAVDTGRLRANWRLGVGGPVTGTTDATDKTGIPTNAAIDAALPANAAGTTLYITNNLPYAWRLENGWSKKEPLGMVGITVVEFAAIVDSAAATVRGSS